MEIEKGGYVMHKINDYIKKNKLNPSDCVYHTNRTLRIGKEKGRIRILVHTTIAMVEYKCPKCGYEGYQEKKWKRPFSVKCKKCDFLIRVPRLRDAFKREMKQV